MQDANEDSWKFQAERDSIGLAFSGGGHRAALFALGGLLYLVDTGAHRRVRSISSVSGGSLLNAYLGLLKTPVSELEPDALEPVARKLATCIAGRPEFWRAGIACMALTLVAAVLAGTYPALWTLAVWIGLGIVTILVGRLAGGSLWGWWGTWAFVIGAGSLVCNALAFAFIAVFLRFDFSALVSVILFTLAGIVIRQRGRVTAMAFGATICALARPGQTDPGMNGLGDTVRHVFCATEMHGGRHCYFTHDFVYSPGIGVGHSGDVPLRAVMQASAAFPGAFPFRRIPTQALRFRVWDMMEVEGGPAAANPSGKIENIDRIDNLPATLLLTDGGVNDNLGLSWYTASPEAGRRVERWLVEMTNNCSLLGGGLAMQHPDLGPSMRLGLAASTAMQWQPNVTVVFNAGAPHRWKGDISARLASVVEGIELYSTVIATYNALQDLTSRRYVERLRRAEARGAMVELGKVGVRLASYGEKPTAIDRRWNAVLESIPWPRDIIAQLWQLAKSSARVPTTLNPLGREAAADLLWYGYMQAMVCLRAELGLDLYEMPTRTRFEALVDGVAAG